VIANMNIAKRAILYDGFIAKTFLNQFLEFVRFF
jgi:hypothetical protein